MTIFEIPNIIKIVPSRQITLRGYSYRHNFTIYPIITVMKPVIVITPKFFVIVIEWLKNACPIAKGSPWKKSDFKKE
jgi:hypothetical protein